MARDRYIRRVVWRKKRRVADWIPVPQAPFIPRQKKPYKRLKRPPFVKKLLRRRPLFASWVPVPLAPFVAKLQRRRRVARRLPRHQHPRLAAWLIISPWIPHRKKRQILVKAKVKPKRRAKSIGFPAVLLVLVQQAWVWNGQAATLTFKLGTLSKAWVWQANSAVLNFGATAALQAWVWARNAPGLSAGLATISKAWQWLGQAATISGQTGTSLIQQLISFVYPGWRNKNYNG